MHGKSRWLSAAVVLLLVAAAPAVALGKGSKHVSAGSTAAAAHTPRQGEWRGGTSQGLRIVFDVLNTRKGLMVQAVDVEAEAHCAGFDLGFGIGGFQRLVKADGTFRIHLYDPFFGSFDFKGRLKRDNGGGLLGFTVPLLNKDGTTQACSSGQIAWKAAPPPAGQAATGSSARVQYRIDVTRSKSGRVSWTVTKG